MPQNLVAAAPSEAEFLEFVAERRDGWAVLYAEAAARGGPLAGRIAELRSRIVGIVGRLLAGTRRAGGGDEQEVTVEGRAHALVGAGESLANWWLDHPRSRPLRSPTGWWLTEARLGPFNIGDRDAG